MGQSEGGLKSLPFILGILEKQGLRVVVDMLIISSLVSEW